MPVSQVSTEVVYEEIPSVETPDPVVGRLWIAVIVVIVLLLLGALYILITGLVSPTGPRTALESKLLLAGEGVRVQPNSGEARFDQIVSLAAVGRVSEALTASKSAKKDLKGLELPYAYLAEASVYFGQGEYEKTLKVLDQGIEANKKAIDTQIASYAEQKIVMTPTSLDSRVSIRLSMLKAQTLARLERPEESLEALSEALESDPRAADILALRAATYVQLGQPDKARADYKQALTFIPGYEPALKGLKSLGE